MRTRYTRTVCLLVYVPTSYVVRVYKNARHRPKPRTCVSNLSGRVKIPLNYKVIDFTLGICPDMRTGYTLTVCLLLVYVSTTHVCTMVPDTDPTKVLPWLANLPGCTRISFNYNTIDFKPRIRLSARIGHMRTSCLLVYNVPLPAYYERKMMPGSELSLEPVSYTHLTLPTIYSV